MLSDVGGVEFYLNGKNVMEWRGTVAPIVFMLMEGHTITILEE